MIALLVLFGLPALIAAVAAIVVTARDGYGRMAVRRPLDRIRPL